MIRRIVPVLGLLLFGGCTKPATGAPPTIHRSLEDTALLEISRRAQETFPDFIEKLLNPAPGERDFLVKYPFEADPGSGFSHELLWLAEIQIENGVYYGSLANNPYYIARLALGDRVSFDPNLVADWMYRKEQRIIGGGSIKYLIEEAAQSGLDGEARRYYSLFE